MPLVLDCSSHSSVIISSAPEALGCYPRDVQLQEERELWRTACGRKLGLRLAVWEDPLRPRPLDGQQCDGVETWRYTLENLHGEAVWLMADGSKDFSVDENDSYERMPLER